LPIIAITATLPKDNIWQIFEKNPDSNYVNHLFEIPGSSIQVVRVYLLWASAPARNYFGHACHSTSFYFRASTSFNSKLLLSYRTYSDCLPDKLVSFFEALQAEAGSNLCDCTSIEGSNSMGFLLLEYMDRGKISEILTFFFFARFISISKNCYHE